MTPEQITERLDLIIFYLSGDFTGPAMLDAATYVALDLRDALAAETAAEPAAASVAA